MQTKYLNFIKENVEVQEPIIKDIKLSKIAPLIEYTIIRKGVTKDDVKNGINEALTNHFYGVCVPAELVDFAIYNIEDNTKLKVISCANYPKGNNSESENLIEVSKLIADNVDEIDLVMDYTQLKKAGLEQDLEVKSSLYNQVESKLRPSINECHKNGVIVKIIIEVGTLTIDEVTKACEIVSTLGADYVMTSTGTNGNGSDFDKIKEMRRVLPDHIKIKVAGGVRSIQDCDKLYQYVDRIGTSVVPK